MLEKIDPPKLADQLEDKFGSKIEQMLKDADKKPENNAADSGAGLNPSQPPFTEREEKTEAAEKITLTREEIEELLKSESMRDFEKEALKEAVGWKKTGDIAEEKSVVPEKPGASEQSPIDLIKTVEKPERESKKSEEIEAALGKAREDYVDAIFAQEKAAKEEGKLTGVRAKIMEFFKSGITSHETDKTRIPEREARIGGAQAEAQEAKDKFLKTQENYKAAIRAYRNEEVDKLEKRTEELMVKGIWGKNKTEKDSEEYAKEKLAKEILLATTLREAAKIDSLRSDKQIEQMGKSRRFINEKAEEFADWYKALPWQAKLGTSLGLAGLALGGAVIGSAAILTATFAGQVALRTLGGAMTTAGVEGFIKKQQEKGAEKKLVKEFDGKFLEALKNQGNELDDKLFEIVKGQQGAKNKRMVAAGLTGGIIGTGILASAVKEAFGWGGGANVKTGAGTGVEGGGSKGLGAAGAGGKFPPLSPDEFDSGESKISPLEKLEELHEKIEGKSIEAVETIKSVKGPSLIELEIGNRGPEGAIIDHLRSNEVIAKQYGWDGQTPLGQWAGTKAHQIWLASVEGELAKPGMTEKLTAQGFTADAEGYAKAMHKIGKGFVEIDPSGKLSLSDNISFLKAPVPPLEELGGASEPPISAPSPEVPVEGPSAPAPEIPAEPAAAVKGELLNGDELLDEKIKDTVKKFVDPGILTDKTFKAAGKLTLGKILEEVPPEAYKNKFALSNYWHSLSEIGVKTPKLPGTGFLGDLSYDDVRKYAEMTKFLRENSVLKSVVGLKNMTVEEFLKIYGGDLGKK